MSFIFCRPKWLFFVSVTSVVANADTAEFLTDNLHLPGSAYVTFTETEVIDEGYFGFSDEALGAHVDQSTLFYWHSLTKPVMGAAAVMMVKDGKLKLDAKISDYLPDMRSHCLEAAEPRCSITLRQLLTHTSGYDYPSVLAGKGGTSKAYDDGFFFNPISVNAVDGTMKSYVKGALAIHARLNHAPGTGFTYGISYDVLGDIMEMVSGKSLDLILKQYIFDPLGMKNTFFKVPDHRQSSLVQLYNRKYATYPIPGRYRRYQGYDSQRVLLSKKDYPASGGGGLIGTTRDFVVFLQGTLSLFNGALEGIYREYLYCSQIPVELGDKPLAKSFFDAETWSYSFGFGLHMKNVSERCASKLFWAGYSNNQFVIDLEERRGALFLTNLFPLDHDISIALNAVR